MGIWSFVTIMLLLSVVYSDFRFRIVYLWQIIALYLFLAGTGHFISPWRVQLINTLFCVFFLALQMGLAYIWIRRKRQKDTGPVIDHQIGMGDILLIPAFATVFSPFEFLWTYTAALVGTLLVAFSIQWRGLSARQFEIPLAGGICLFYGVWLMIRHSLY